MKKLIELLKQKDGYENVDYQKQSDGGYMFWLDGIAYREERICSKKFGFIKWLVENDKINLGKIKKLYRKSNEHSISTYPVMYEYSDLECLLMLLSISNSPIEDLISYLR